MTSFFIGTVKSFLDLEDTATTNIAIHDINKLDNAKKPTKIVLSM